MFWWDEFYSILHKLFTFLEIMFGFHGHQSHPQVFKGTIRKVRSSSWHTYRHSATFETLENFVSNFYGKQICWPTEKITYQSKQTEHIAKKSACIYHANCYLIKQIAYKSVTLLKMTFVKEYQRENLKMWLAFNPRRSHKHWCCAKRINVLWG